MDKSLIEERYFQRRSLDEIAKERKTTKQNICSILKRIKSKKSISDGLIINPSKSGLTSEFFLKLKLKNTDSQTVQSFIDKLEKIPNVVFVKGISGEWDTLIYLVARNPSEFNEVRKNMLLECRDEILTAETMSVLESPLGSDLVLNKMLLSLL